jgi:hypothetical protein
VGPVVGGFEVLRIKNWIGIAFLIPLGAIAGDLPKPPAGYVQPYVTGSAPNARPKSPLNTLRRTHEKLVDSAIRLSSIKMKQDPRVLEILREMHEQPAPANPTERRQ